MPGVPVFAVVHSVFVLPVINRILFPLSSLQVIGSDPLVSDARARVSYRGAKATAVDQLGKIFGEKHRSVPNESQRQWLFHESYFLEVTA